MSAATTPDPILSVRGLHHAFGYTQALRGVDIDVQPGDVLAVMGPSGSGKSTLLHCMAGILVPDQGTVIYAPDAAGTPTVMSGLGESERSRLRLTDFGFVFQFGQLLPELTALDNVSLPLLLAGIKRPEALHRSIEILDQLGLGEFNNKLPGQLSGGQAQRVAIARAMVSSPAVLFADEPTGSLDSLAAENVLTLMLKLVRERGTTVVMITHDPRTAAYADREVVIRDGVVAAAHRIAA
jgi:putative ABC transport system ATP-binding protein